MAPYKTERKIDGFFYCSETAERGSAEARTRGNSPEAPTAPEAPAAPEAPETYEIFRVLEGHFYCAVEGQKYSLSPGDILFTLPNERHTTAPDTNEAYTRQIIQLERGYLTEKFPDIVSKLDKKPAGRQNYIPASLASKYAVDIIFSQLHEYALSDKDEAETMLRLCSLVLVTKISEILKYEYTSGEIRLKKNIKKITDYINDNITAPINLDGIANYLYLDKSYVCRLFKRETGLTINAYINMTRVSMAKQMISSGTSPRAAYTRCGYNDYSTFYRAFRRYAGITPEEFKRGYSDNQDRRRET